jgi:flagellar basal-body rod modification protein FlgD
MTSPLPAALTNPGSNSGAASSQPQPLTSLDFLKILVAEFQNQDPTSPTDPTQYASQMVQFSNLGQLEKIDNAVQQSPSAALMQASSAYIGREVVAPGNLIGVKGGKATSITFAPVSTDNYTALVFDASGRNVDSASLGKIQAGALQTFRWQPPSSAGDGQYLTKIVNSKNVALNGLLEQGVVQSIGLSGGGIVLDLGNLTLSEDQITRIAQP